MRPKTPKSMEEGLLAAVESGSGVTAILDAALASMGGGGEGDLSWGAVFAERENGHEALHCSRDARPEHVEQLLRWVRHGGQVRHQVVERDRSDVTSDGVVWTKVCARVGGSLPGERLTVVLCWSAGRVRDRGEAELVFTARMAAAMIGPRCAPHVPVEVPLDEGADLLFERSAVGMMLLDLSGRCQRVNAAARALLGRGATGVVGKHWTELVHAEDVQRAHPALNDLLMGMKNSPRIELRFVREDEAEAWAAVTLSTLADRDQRPWSVVAVVEDLKHQRGATEHVERTEARFRSIFEQAPVGMVDASPEGLIRSANRQFCSMLGYTELELVGRHWTSITAPEDIPANKAKREMAIAAQESPYSLEKRYLTKDGRAVMASVHVSIVRDEKGNVERLFATVEDLTEKRELEAKVLQKAKMESLGRLAGGISHDFGNLLTAITGNLDLAASEIESGTGAGALARLGEIRSATESAARLTRQLLGFAKREPLSPKAVSVVPICERVGMMLQRLSPLGITVRVEADEGGEVRRVRGDAGQIEQIVLNLAINARDAIDPPGVVAVRVGNERASTAEQAKRASEMPAGDWVRISVSDTGRGISAGDLPQVFEPFFSTKRGGFGLGLANVYAMVKQWGGDVQVSSKPGRGSRFDVLLPCAGPELALAEDSDPSCITPASYSQGLSAWSRPEAPTGLRETIEGRPLAVVIDDQPEIRELVRVIFDRAGYRVLVALDGREGMGLIQDHAAELDLGGVVLTDQRLPFATGLEIASVCRTVAPRAGVVLCSGDVTAVETEARAMGVGLLPKPFGPTELLSAVRQSRAEMEAKGPPSVHPLTIACD